jgi:hypothetical protein
MFDNLFYQVQRAVEKILLMNRTNSDSECSAAAGELCTAVAA